jgi:hypothetical protein
MYQLYNEIQDAHWSVFQNKDLQALEELGGLNLGG